MTQEEKNEIIRRQLHEILDIVLDGNGFESRKRNETGTLPTLFMRFSGHVSKMDVDLYTDGWEGGMSWDHEWEFSTNDIIPGDRISAMRNLVETAYRFKSETEVLRRDVARQEDKVKGEKEKLSTMKRTLRKKERKEKAAVGAAT